MKRRQKTIYTCLLILMSFHFMPRVYSSSFDFNLSDSLGNQFQEGYLEYAVTPDGRMIDPKTFNEIEGDRYNAILATNPEGFNTQTGRFDPPSSDGGERSAQLPSVFNQPVEKIDYQITPDGQLAHSTPPYNFLTEEEKARVLRENPPEDYNPETGRVEFRDRQPAANEVSGVDENQEIGTTQITPGQAAGITPAGSVQAEVPNPAQPETALTRQNLEAFFTNLKTNMHKNLSSAISRSGEKKNLPTEVDTVKLQPKGAIFGSDEDSFFGECEMMLKKGTSWKEIADLGKGGSEEKYIAEYFVVSYGRIFRDLLQDLNEDNANETNESLMQKLSFSALEARKNAEKIQQCVALAYMTTKVDYTDASTSSVEGVDNIKRSFDQKIIGRKNGVETQDFPACSKAIDTYNAAFLGGQALQIGQTFQFQEASMDASIKAQENANDITAGMQAQKEMTDEQKKIANTRAAFSGAKGAAMAAAFSAIPTRKKLVAQCQAQVDKTQGTPAGTAYDAYVKAIEESLENANISVTVEYGAEARTGSERSNEVRTIRFTNSAPAAGTGGTTATNPSDNLAKTLNITKYERDETPCASVASQKVSLTMNEVSCREKIKKAMIEAGVETASNLLKAKLLDDQSDMIGDAINNVKKFDDDNPAPTFEEFNAEICQADPTLPECANAGPVFERGREFNGNGINVSGFSRQNTSAGIRREDSVNSDKDDDSSNNGRGEGVTGVGTTVGAPKNSTGFTDPSPGAASMKRGGGGGAGGGGGGGVGKAASSGGGGGGIGGGGGSRGVSGGNSRRVSFTGGGGGLSFGGGGKGGSRKVASKGGNPFSKFFKNKKGGKKGDTLNFRGVASVGGKKDSLFGMISNRYGKIKDDRLIKYKAEK